MSIKSDFEKMKDNIPDYPGAEKGLLGVKAPFSPRQTSDIEDRLRAAGKISAQQQHAPIR